MVKICNSCGAQTVDDKSLFCNKCGCPFPQTPPKKSAVSQQKQPQVSAVPKDASGGMPRQVRTTRRSPGLKKTGRGGSLPFKRLIARDYIRLIYIAGAIVIILVSLLGISNGFSKTGTEAVNASFTNTTTLVENPSASPLFWIGFLIFANLIWRIFCELVAVIFRMYDTISSGGKRSPGDDTPEYSDEEEAGYDGEGNGEYIECPHCLKIVPEDQLRVCEVCGVQGCSNCIRMMGLLKKKMTCKECFENK